MIASKNAELELPFRTTRRLGGTYGKGPLPPMTPSPRNRFLVHYSEDAPTGQAAEDAAWRSATSSRVMDSIKRAEQFGQEHSSRVQQLQVRFLLPCVAIAGMSMTDAPCTGRVVRHELLVQAFGKQARLIAAVSWPPLEHDALPYSAALTQAIQ